MRKAIMHLHHGFSRELTRYAAGVASAGLTSSVTSGFVSPPTAAGIGFCLVSSIVGRTSPVHPLSQKNEGNGTNLPPIVRAVSPLSYQRSVADD